MADNKDIYIYLGTIAAVAAGFVLWRLHSSRQRSIIYQNPCSMNISQKGKDHLAAVEGIRFEAYLDQAGHWTIGIGHLIDPATESQLKYQQLTLEEVYALLDEDIAEAEAAVCSYVSVPLNQNEFDALVSIVFNIGVGAFADSTFLKRLNAGADKQSVAEAISWWNKITDPATGQKIVSDGIVNRRQKEIELFLS